MEWLLDGVLPVLWVSSLNRKAFTKNRVERKVARLKFPNGYASNLVRCVNMKELRLHGMKSHDCHVFMQKLIPIAFHELLPESVWNALTEISSRLENEGEKQAHVDASIVEAYLVEEIGLFTSQYFEPQVLCKRNMPGRNDDLP
ncbi:UNVERIFIED_CONTAM: hypothetical protein Slati_3946800 [Sesamum latifolium]|uniref:Uncharacterized protein n=1 Tax=Sesamum latifolium TaxID=2727402 RepID=A0AAW2TNY8_9LAMI